MLLEKGWDSVHNTAFHLSNSDVNLHSPPERGCACPASHAGRLGVRELRRGSLDWEELIEAR